MGALNLYAREVIDGVLVVSFTCPKEILTSYSDSTISSRQDCIDGVAIAFGKMVLDEMVESLKK
jgi:hypothetical protein